MPIDDAWQVELVFEDLESYASKCIESKKSAYEKVVFDSEGEKEFAHSLESSPVVKLFVKLPPKFVVDTPLGNYNHDWAIVVESDEGDKLYLVRETKFGIEYENLRQSEKEKILCGKKHFDAIKVDYKMAIKKDLSDLK